uniref:RNA demethylase ALKBH5-like n=1 Tax=Nelumbo nucifera TaxID=4432 RepID=A0A822Y4S3_NELNU|nr:TPA_asm: hypothetical protein HUJ06_026072 [Nelumbo nucifera]
MENFLKKLEMPEIVDMLSEGLCSSCKDLLQTRLQNLFSDNTNGKFNGKSLSSGNHSENSSDFCSANTSSLCSPEKSFASSTNGPHQQESSSWSSTRTPGSVHSSKRQGHVTSSSPASVSSRQQSLDRLDSKVAQNDTFAKSSNGVSNEQVVQKGLSLSPEQEQIRFSQVGRKKDFVYFERVNGKKTNVLQGLELHTRVFNTMEQEKIVDYVYKLQRTGQNGQLKERTYTEPKKWMRGKGRVTIQFGCCYNYAVDKNGNPPGIVRDEEVDPIPPLFKAIIKRLVRWNVLPVTCVPNSCIVNIYDEGDCIPPHIDHHDFLRPFCTVSFLTECNILFGSNLKIEGAGEFSGPVAIPLPVGYV